MNTKQAKELIGKRALFQLGDAVAEGRITTIAPSGKYVEVTGFRYGYEWVSMDKLTFLEELPEQTESVEAVTASAADAATKLQETNTILNEQLSQARAEVERLKQAWAEEAPGRAPLITGPTTLMFPTTSNPAPAST
jgi:hypothetical protein